MVRYDIAILLNSWNEDDSVLDIQISPAFDIM